MKLTAGFILHLWDIFTSILITDTKLRDLQRFLPCNHPDSKLREDVIKTDKCYCSLTRKVASLSTREGTTTEFHSSTSRTPLVDY